jgi:uncharacterized protein
MQSTRRTLLVGLATTALCGSVASATQVKEALKFEIYKDAKGEFRWRITAGNNRIIADSGEGYKNKEDCRHGIELIKEGAKGAEVVDRTEG